MIRTITIETPLGDMAAAAIKEGICFLEFTSRPGLESEINKLAQTFNTTIKPGSNRHLRALRRQLKEYFRGKRKEFTLKVVTPGTDFQREVWETLKKIPYGETISYLEQAKMMNNPGAFRAVAGANGSNRIAIVIPCHRVIGSDGEMVGYGGGLDKKKWLIDHERKFSGKPVNGILF